MSYDPRHLKQLRRDAELHNIDFTRAKIVPAEGGYTVRFSAPLFDVRPLLDDVPRVVECHNAAWAEGELLTGLLRLQRAERQKVRLGRVVGRDNAWVCHTPLTAEEVDAYLAEVNHKKQVAQLQSDLQDLLARNAQAKTRNAGADELSRRYGLGATVHKASPATKPRKRNADEGATQ